MGLLEAQVGCTRWLLLFVEASGWLLLFPRGIWMMAGISWKHLAGCCSFLDACGWLLVSFRSIWVVAVNIWQHLDRSGGILEAVECYFRRMYV